MDDILDGLNEKQLEAVKQIEGPCLIIAGAGSGKTKVITHKIAYLMNERNIKPWQVLAITFTNKAAKEMKERAEKLIGDDIKDMWIGTFHSICVRILRRCIDKLGFDSSFAIFDTTDQKALIKECIKICNLDDKLYTDRSIANEISNSKNEMIDEIEYEKNCVGDFRKEKIAQVYKLYQQKLKQNNGIDFDDIINFTVKILTENQEILEYYTEKFKYILVDEYQDTNKAQFTLITLLASKYGNLTVVGDNDQGIYSFRGADIQNILNFEKDFLGTKIIKLEQNYRCTKNILDIANSVIKNNETKYEKKLWTENGEGTKPSVLIGDNEYEEATNMINEINYLKREESLKNSDFAILYRMNTQSRAVEDILRRENIPYKIIGGLKFYERKEIKDIISYLRLINNTSDNFSLRRIINEPKRGVGKTSLEQVEKLADENNISMYQIIKNAQDYDLTRVFANTRDFISIIEELIQEKDKKQISQMIKETLNKTKYIKALEQEDSTIAENRIANLDEFLNVAIEFEDEYAENDLSSFLESITLSSDIDSMEETENCITLMTLHSAKGLEFPVVFMIGMEEGVFPSYRSIGEQKELEEERRLCYVGITRARKKLYFTAAKTRTVFGSTSCNNLSRFLKEIPEDLIESFKQDEEDEIKDLGYKWEYGKETASKINIMKTESKVAAGSIKKEYSFRTPESFLNGLHTKKDEEIDFSKYAEGVKVYHKKFGDGIINFVEQEGEDLKVDIEFEKVGHKRLMARFANLEIKQE